MSSKDIPMQNRNGDNRRANESRKAGGIMRTKICRKCREELPATPDYFYRGKRGKYGLRSYCKPCHNKTGAERKRRIKKYKTVPERCESCQRLDKKKDKCMVMVEFTEN